MCMTRPSRLRRLASRGFTLIELVIFIVVVAAGVAGILAVYVNTVKSSADPLARKQALAIAEALLEEITMKEFSNPSGGYSGSSRALFDDVDDYNGYSTSGGMVDPAGNAISGLSGYDVSPAVAVSSVTLGGVPVKKIVVNILFSQGTITLVGYRGNY